MRISCSDWDLLQKIKRRLISAQNCSEPQSYLTTCQSVFASASKSARKLEKTKIGRSLTQSGARLKQWAIRSKIHRKERAYLNLENSMRTTTCLSVPIGTDKQVVFCTALLIGKREISPQLCCGDEWRVEFEAVVGRFSIQKNSRVPPA